MHSNKSCVVLYLCTAQIRCRTAFIQQRATNPFNRFVNRDTKLVKWKHFCVRKAEAFFTVSCKEE